MDRQVLATANTNIAVDNIVEGLVARNISVVRVGRAVKIRKELQAYCMDSLVRPRLPLPGLPLYPTLGPLLVDLLQGTSIHFSIFIAFNFPFSATAI